MGVFMPVPPPLETHVEEEPTLYDIYSKWLQSLQDIDREVSCLRAYLSQLKECENTCKVSVSAYWNPVYASQSDPWNTSANTVYPVNYPTYPPMGTSGGVTVEAPFISYHGQIPKIQEILDATPKNAEHWLKHVAEKVKELSVAKETILKLGILKKAKQHVP